MRILIIGDDIQKLHPKTDTSLYLLREFVQQNCLVHWACPENLSWKVTQVLCEAREVREPGNVEKLPQLAIQKEYQMEDFDIVLIRKEPPFDDSYMRLCWILAPYEKKVYMSNAPSVLLRYHEKMLPFEAVAAGVLQPAQVIQTCITDHADIARDFVKSVGGDSVILKPWLGFGGRDIQLMEKEGFLGEANKYFSGTERWILQFFEEAIFSRGDRRVLFLGGKYIGDVVRLPKKGHFVSNLVRGGQAFLRDLDEEEKELVKCLEPWLKKIGIDFAGADFINGKLSEINITCPTALEAYERLTGKNLAPWIVEHLMRAAKK